MTINYKIPPSLPFEGFKWRWATTTPTESLNKKEIMFGVLEVLYNHNNKKHATKEFENELNELTIKLRKDNNMTVPDLAKMERGVGKNIIENSGQYWKALGLIGNTTNGNISVTELGKKIIEKQIDDYDFIRHQYNNFVLPNLNIEKKDVIKKWEEKKLQIHPFKIIFGILLALLKEKKNPLDLFLSSDELCKVVIPLSQYNDLPYSEYIKYIFQFREDKNHFDSWPNVIPADNDRRMVREYLLFLSNFGFLELIKIEEKERFYLKAEIINLLNKTIVLEPKQNLSISQKSNFNYKEFLHYLNSKRFYYSERIVCRFIASVLSKRFVILSGLSGSGKTKLAQNFVEWICQSNSQYKIVSVGADWVNREPLLGYPNGLNAEEYVTSENSIINLMIAASLDENSNKPFFIILDEMNLSHVERYFADFLSVMESNDTIKLYTGKQREGTDKIAIPSEIKWPRNLFIIGTVNIDETTYMFSPKVLDRANVIEFRVEQSDLISHFLQLNTSTVESTLFSGSQYATAFLTLSDGLRERPNEIVQNTLRDFFDELKEIGAEFGFRTAKEICILIEKIRVIENNYTQEEMLDIAIMQKLLPKLHGSRSNIIEVIKKLLWLCTRDMKKDLFMSQFDIYYKNNFLDIQIIYPISFEKLKRMYRNLILNGYVSYSEA